MALINCPQCGRAIADTVKVCPGCGCSISGHLEEMRRQFFSPASAPAGASDTKSGKPKAARDISGDAPEERRRFMLENPVTRVGRQTDNELILGDRSVSRYHARILIEAGRYYVQDCGSSFGSFVRGAKVERAEVFDGDLIVLGNFELVFCAPPPGGGHASVLVRAANQAEGSGKYCPNCRAALSASEPVDPATGRCPKCAAASSPPAVPPARPARPAAPVPPPAARPAATPVQPHAAPAPVRDMRMSAPGGLRKGLQAGIGGLRKSQQAADQQAVFRKTCECVICGNTFETTVLENANSSICEECVAFTPSRFE